MGSTLEKVSLSFLRLSELRQNFKRNVWIPNVDLRVIRVLGLI